MVPKKEEDRIIGCLLLSKVMYVLIVGISFSKKQIVNDVNFQALLLLVGMFHLKIARSVFGSEL